MALLITALYGLALFAVGMFFVHQEKREIERERAKTRNSKERRTGKERRSGQERRHEVALSR